MIGRIGRIADRRGALVACLLAGCFTDNGLQTTSHADDTTGATGGATTGTTDATSTTDPGTGDAPTDTTATTTTGEPPPVCGNNVIEAPLEECDDGNLDDGDACLSTCVQATCGDGFLWGGVEECDDGPNNSFEPGACRPNCEKPACGDSGLYVGPLGDPILVSGPGFLLAQGNDAPRSIAADGMNRFSALWRVDGQPDQVQVQRLDVGGALVGASLNYLAVPTTDVRDPAIAVAPNGDTAVVWETGTDLVLATTIGGGMPTLVDVTVGKGNFFSPTVGIGPAGQAAVAFLGDPGNNTTRVHVRLIADLGDVAAAPPEQVVSEHLAGDATPPTVAFDPTGAFLVAWGDPSGALLYRRHDVEGTPGPIVTSALRIGATGTTAWSPWTGAALQAHDSSAVLAGLDAGGHLALQRFDVADVAQATIQLDEQDPRYVPFVDVASDPWGHLAVAWNACGTPLDVGAINCDGLLQRWSVRWFYADLTPLGPSASIVSGATSAPVSVAFAPNGATAVTYIEGTQAKVRIAGLACP